MNEVRVIFSPHTAEPLFLRDLAVALWSAQIGVAQAVCVANVHVLRAVLAAQTSIAEAFQHLGPHRS